MSIPQQARSKTEGINTMKVVALLSGGKDSCYNLMHCIANGHEVVALATLVPETGIDELDSYMYQSVGTTVFLPLIARALKLPLYRHTIQGKPLNVSSTYGSREGSAATGDDANEVTEIDSDAKSDETEDLTSLLQLVLTHHPTITALSSGAILSTYQRLRIEHVASRFGLTCLSFLWQRPERVLVDEMIAAGLGEGVVLVKVAGLGLEVGDVGRTLGGMRRKLGILEDKYGCHVAGEGGEFETITLDCPLFHERIEILESETIVTDPSPVAYMRATSVRLVPKTIQMACGKEVPFIPPTPAELRGLLHIDEEGIQGMSVFDDRSEEIIQAMSDWSHETQHTSSHRPDLIVEPLAELKLADRMGPLEPERVVPSIRRRGRWFSAVVEGWTEEGESIGQEVTQCFEDLRSTLLQEGLSLLHVQHQNFLLSNISDFPLANKAYSAFFGTSPPSRACVSVALPTHQRVRLEAYGFDDAGSAPNTPEARSALHVQSMSYWAPANIGPYSQAVTVSNRLSIAGQIGLIPSTLAFPEPRSFVMEAVLALQHVRRITQVLRSKESAGGGWEGWVEGVIGWYAREGDLYAAREIWQRHCEADQLDPAIPIVFIQAKALPKGALVEWQVVMHSGRLDSSSATLHEDPDLRATCTYSVEVASGGSTQWCESAIGESSFGIRTAANLPAHLSQDTMARAVSIRTFHRSDISAMDLRTLRQHVGESTGGGAFVPCLNISTVTETDLRYCLVGLGV